MAGSEIPDEWIEESRYGYIFEIDPYSLDDVQPDEDEIGRAVHRGTYSWLNRSAKLVLPPDLLVKVRDGEYMAWATAGKLLVEHMTKEQKHQMIRDGSHIANRGSMQIVAAWRVDKTESESYPRRQFDDDQSAKADREQQVFDLSEPVDVGVEVERHYGPGPHPGTGTPQEVHAGNGEKPSFAEEFWTNDEVNRRIKKWELAQDPDVGKAEMGILVTSSGVEIEFVGSKHRIDFTQETIQGARYDDADYKVFSHTHPSDMPFSPEDFMVSVLMKLDKLRVVSPDWVYEMTINPDMNDITASNIYGGMKDRVANLLVETDDERLAMKLSGVHPDHAMSETMSNHVHNSWQEFAGLFSGAILDYRRIARRR